MGKVTTRTEDSDEVLDRVFLLLGSLYVQLVAVALITAPSEEDEPPGQPPAHIQVQSRLIKSNLISHVFENDNVSGGQEDTG